MQLLNCPLAEWKKSNMDWHIVYVSIHVAFFVHEHEECEFIFSDPVIFIQIWIVLQHCMKWLKTVFTNCEIYSLKILNKIPIHIKAMEKMSGVLRLIGRPSTFRGILLNITYMSMIVHWSSWSVASTSVTHAYGIFWQWIAKTHHCHHQIVIMMYDEESHLIHWGTSLFLFVHSVSSLHFITLYFLLCSGTIIFSLSQQNWLFQPAVLSITHFRKCSFFFLLYFYTFML